MGKQFIIVLMVWYSLILYFRINNTPLYNKSVFRFVVFCESILLWVSIAGVIHAILDEGAPDNIGMVYLIFGIPFGTSICLGKK